MKLTFQKFHSWYSNLPLKDRSIPHTYWVNKDRTSLISFTALYELMNEQEDKRREAQVELDRLLKIAQGLYETR